MQRKLFASPEEAKTNMDNIKHNPKSIFLHPCTTEETSSIIQQLPNKTSSGHDNILKKLAKSLLHPLCIIFNQSMQDGKFPEAMKKADVTPLLQVTR